ncbi:hypothetical protein [Desulfosporosinus sp. BG]|uniref:hypothetical protein n=1 Tax=Desulfosporosinus sp. BG TaxID=1633135 RepID=UPI000A456A27|nr:hypothetical protein [Desulfosporosinus sp. BG]
MSADDKALRNSTGLVQGWTDAAVPEDTVFARISPLAGWQGAAHMRRNKDVPSVECARRHCLRTY